MELQGLISGLRQQHHSVRMLARYGLSRSEAAQSELTDAMKPGSESTEIIAKAQGRFALSRQTSLHSSGRKMKSLCSVD
jgi:hypothetical protein